MQLGIYPASHCLTHLTYTITDSSENSKATPAILGIAEPSSDMIEWKEGRTMALSSGVWGQGLILIKAGLVPGVIEMRAQTHFISSNLILDNTIITCTLLPYIIRKLNLPIKEHTRQDLMRRKKETNTSPKIRLQHSMNHGHISIRPTCF
jgi:hypothetical protein